MGFKPLPTHSKGLEYFNFLFVKRAHSERFHLKVSFTFEGKTVSTEAHFNDVEKLSHR